MKKFIILFLIIFITGYLYCEDAISILKKVDINLVYDSIKFDGELTINNAGKKTIKTFNSIAKGNKNTFNVFTNQEDIGTKMLKKDGNLFVYMSEVEEVIPIVGHLLQESVMGSDLSYEDLLNNDTLESQYNVLIIDETVLNNKKVWILELNAKYKTVSYKKRIYWVDKESFYPLRIEYYGTSGKKIKEMQLLEIKLFGNRYFPTVREMKNLLRKNSKTIIKFKNIEMDIKIPDNIFSLKNLEK